MPTDKPSATVLSAAAVRAGPIVDHRAGIRRFDLPNADDAQGDPAPRAGTTS
jgi:hypothetical protein